jgi:hypothetical protein
MARRPQLEAFARQHNLKVGTIADLIRHCLSNERSVERSSQQRVQTEFGEFDLYTYQATVQQGTHYALAKGRLDGSVTPLVRVHVSDTLRDLIGIRTDAIISHLRISARLRFRPCRAQALTTASPMSVTVQRSSWFWASKGAMSEADLISCARPRPVASAKRPRAANSIPGSQSAWCAAKSGWILDMRLVDSTGALTSVGPISGKNLDLSVNHHVHKLLE